MKKTLLILGVIVLVLVIGYATFLLLSNKKTLEQTPVPVESTATSGTASSSSSQTIPPEVIQVRTEIDKKIMDGVIPTEVTPDPASLLVDEFPKREAPSMITDYSTEYSKDSHSFFISLYKFPLEETRLRAEKYLLQKLGITEKEACALDVTVKVNMSISATLAGQDLGLSFCPGSVDLSAYTENTDGVGSY
ncbi:MAG: hypothetical protein AAB519_03175 [Patescibacteria group bacterium]